MTAIVVLVLLSAMAGSWLGRVLLLNSLQDRHAGEFAMLGKLTPRQMTSLLPKHQDLQIRFFGYLWGGQAFRLGDPRAAGLAGLAIACDVALAGSAVALFWLAAK